MKQVEKNSIVVYLAIISPCMAKLLT